MQRMSESTASRSRGATVARLIPDQNFGSFFYYMHLVEKNHNPTRGLRISSHTSLPANASNYSIASFYSCAI